ncbi:related to BLM10 - proteasome activator subunit [Melanopsichium pennsylvanicum]|uniref:Related to BLM10 - proteasome activator subunit n=2 Tax=Melanopsichium pennsylvanicum TaxID=63383 RepID=A0AAJ4XIZ0_9BASI|nr:arm repeat-containing protein [Melanopsichium pennsylvanicum 4]SNX83239.1 related to BLM10 - proteasome activator subunit [Melanopsichium pennsylvanicum]
MDDDDVLEIDSPMEPAVDIDEDEDEEMPTLNLDGGSSDRNSQPTKKPKGENRHLQLDYPQSLPYECESLEHFDLRLDHIIRRLVDCVRTKDYDIGLIQWNHRLQCLLSLKYPIVRNTRARLARLYYELAVLPGLNTRCVELAANMCITLIENKKKLDIKDLTLPWRPLYNILEKELFPKRRRTGLTNIADVLLDLAETSQRFFPASETDEMLRTFLPKMDGSNLNSVIATQAFLVHFLPISHPQRWLPTMFRLWESFNSSLFDDQMLDLLARLAELHVTDPSISSASSARKAGSLAEATSRPEVQSAERAEGDEQMDERNASQKLVDADSTSTSGTASPSGRIGLFSDIGIFTEQQYSLIMTKCLKSAGLPVGSTKAANAALMAQSASVRSGPDAAASGATLKMKKPSDRLRSFAVIIAYSISRDGPSASKAASASNVPTPTDAGASKPLTTYPAGSKALDHLAKFVQATESYFHPSNWGMWQISLSNLVQQIMFEFLKRVKEEERPQCKTPQQYRLTDEMKTEIVSILRTVCLLSMFSKDPITIAASQASLKRMAILAPEMVFPAVLDRAFNSLEALETTHRTNAVITALSTLSPVFTSRQLYRAGGKHLVPLLQLCIPGIDLNDPMKTMSTCMFVLLSTLSIRIDDLTRPEAYADDEQSFEAIPDQPALKVDAPETSAAAAAEEVITASPEQEDYELRISTADFEAWISAFFQRVLSLFETLPEEGKGGRTGGKSEEQVINMIMAASDGVCRAMSPYLLQKSFDKIADYCATTVSATSVRVIGSLVGCFARADSKMVLERLVLKCIANIRAEIANGASSTRTTSTSLPAPSDATLHWNLSVLTGALNGPSEHLLHYKDDLISVLQLITENCRTERGYSFGAKLVQKVISSLTSLYPREQRFVNQETWESEDFVKRSHLFWGKMYEEKAININWHTPNEAEIGMTLELIERVVVPAVDKVEALQAEGLTRDKAWSNDFCRYLMVVRMGVIGMPSLIEEDEVGGGEPAMDLGDEVPEFVDIPPRFKSHFCLTDRKDARYQKVAAFKQRVGKVLHLAAQSTQESGAEDQIDCVKMLIRSIRSFLTCYSYNGEDYKAHMRSLSFFRNIAKLHAKQKAFPRVLFVRRAAFYNTSRARLNSFHRKRTPLTDKLILQILEFCMSNYVGIRQTAQNTLDTIGGVYDGTWILCLPKLIQAIQPGVPDDKMKGALYVLGSKGASYLCLTDARFSVEYIMSLLDAQHHSKPSIQKLVRGIINDFIIRFAEPSTLTDKVHSAALNEAADILERALPVDLQTADAKLIEAVAAKRRLRLERVDRLQEELTAKTLEFAQRETTHWAFSIFAARLLRALIRKDRPLGAASATYLAEQMISENPKMRHCAQAAITKILYYVKLRTLASTDENLLLGQAKNPLKHSGKLPSPVTKEWTEQYIASFAESLTPESKLRDKPSQGWLVWGEEEDFYDPPPADGVVFSWEDASQTAIDAVRAKLTQDSWWQSFCRHLSQEKDRDYPGSDSVTLLKSIFQIFGVELLPFITTVTEQCIAEKDRHRHRAASELVCGVYRGSKHWNMKDQAKLWSWLESLLPKIFEGCTPDSQPAWQSCIEYMLQSRDPRRALPLVNYIVQAARDNIGRDNNTASPWEQAKAQNLLRGAMISMNLQFAPFGADEFIRIYSDNFDSHFQEVRSVISEGLADLELLQVNPSFGSVELMLDACSSGQGSLLSRPELYSGRLEKLSQQLAQWRTERTPTAEGTSQYDRAAMTALLWISTTMGDHRNSALAGEVIKYIPDIFAMLELHDNKELSVLARAVLTKISTYPFTSEYAGKLIDTLLQVTRSSVDSWRARLDSLPVLQVIYFQNLFYLNEKLINSIVELLLGLLSDKHLEVREMAATTLSGIVRCSQRQLIKTLKNRFTKTVATTLVPRRGETGYDQQLLTLHSGILGASALLAAFPYEVPDWMPSLIVETVAQHTDDPVPISTTVRKCAADFKRTHQDTWSEDQHKFGHLLPEVNDFTLGRSDYFA